jgi:hypothetical protein
MVALFVSQLVVQFPILATVLIGKPASSFSLSVVWIGVGHWFVCRVFVPQWFDYFFVVCSWR